MKILVKYYKPISKDEMYTYALLGVFKDEVEDYLVWDNGQAYRIEHWINGKKKITTIW